MANFRYTLKPEGPLDATVAVVCEKPAFDETVYMLATGQGGRPLVGTSGERVRRHVRRAGLDPGKPPDFDYIRLDPRKYSIQEQIDYAVKTCQIRDHGTLAKEVFLTNAVQSFDDPQANPTKSDIIREIPRLYRELCALPNLNVIIAMGAASIRSVGNFRYDIFTKQGWTSGITQRRGSRLLTPFGAKFVPTFHPAYYMRGEWRYEPVVQFDVQRAVEERHWKEIRKTQRYWNISPTFEEAMSWIKKLLSSPSPWLSFDIETSQGANGTWYISCIAFSTDPMEAFCIPLMHKDRRPYWPEISTESLIWRGIADLLNQPNRRYVTQNGAAFDTWQLRKHGIFCERMANGFDTFSAHSLLAPDLPHDLAFITSIYTDEEYYKDESGRGQAGFGQVDESAFYVYNCKDAALTLEAALAMIKDMKEL